MKQKVLTFSMLVVILTAGQGFSQEVSKLEPASRIRLTLTPFNQVTGKYSGFENDSIKVYSESLDRMVWIPASSVTNLEVFNLDHGAKRSGAGFLRGFAVGSVVGAILLPLLSDNDSGFIDLTWIFGGAAGGLVGGVVGAIAGSGSQKGKWQTVPVDIIGKNRFYQSRKTTFFKLSIPLQK